MFFTIASFIFCGMLYTETKQDFSGRVHIVFQESNVNRNSFVLLKYFGSINLYRKSSDAGQHRTKWT